MIKLKKLMIAIVCSLILIVGCSSKKIEDVRPEFSSGVIPIVEHIEKSVEDGKPVDDNLVYGFLDQYKGKPLTKTERKISMNLYEIMVDLSMAKKDGKGYELEYIEKMNETKQMLNM